MQLERIHRAAQALICAVWLSGGAAAYQAAPNATVESPSEVDWEGRVLGALARVGEPGSRAAREAARGLAGYGEGALPALLSGLAQRRVTSAEGASLSLDEGRLTILRDAVQQLGRSALVSAAEAALAEHAEYPMPERLPAFLEGIALCGRSADIGVALDLARASETDELAGLAAQRGLERAVRAVAARDASALRELRRWLERASPTMDLALVRGAAACGRPEALRALMDVFGEDEDLTLTLLGQIPRAAHGLARPLDDSLLRKVRDVLADAAAPPSRVRAGLRAAAALGDAGALPEMIERLRAEDPGVRSAALAALHELTGLLYDERVEAWAAWLVREQGWYARGLSDAQRDLGSRDRGQAIAALRAIAQHRYRRDELALIAVEALAYDSAQVRMEVIGTVATLGSPAALPRLREQIGVRSEREDAALRACIARLGGDSAVERLTASAR